MGTPQSADPFIFTGPRIDDPAPVSDDVHETKIEFRNSLQPFGITHIVGDITDEWSGRQV